MGDTRIACVVVQALCRSRRVRLEYKGEGRGTQPLAYTGSSVNPTTSVIEEGYLYHEN